MKINFDIKIKLNQIIRRKINQKKLKNKTNNDKKIKEGKKLMSNMKFLFFIF
jgi:hypothetical protein